MKKVFFYILCVSAAALQGCGGGGGGGNSCALDNLACPAGQYCQFEAGQCGAVGGPGQCVEIATACDSVSAPVCTCDNLTFTNECLATAGGHSVSAAGECA